MLSFLGRPSMGVRGKRLWAHGCRTRNTTTSEESPPCMRPRGHGSDVNRLLLGRQQSVHGSRHRLHVDLRAGAQVSRGGAGARGGVMPVKPRPQQGPEEGRGLQEEQRPQSF